MKKLTIIALAALLVVAFTLPAYAVEHSIGGSWRVRMFKNARFTGTKDANFSEQAYVDQRLRVDWTVAINDNLKLVHRFEVGDLIWGQPGTNPGTDGVNVATSRSYVDFNLMPNWNWKIGLQPFWLNHFIFHANDATGIQTTFALSKDLIFMAFWMVVNTSNSSAGWPWDATGAMRGRDVFPFNDRDATINDLDHDVYGILARIGLGNVTLTPSYYFVHSQAGYTWGGLWGTSGAGGNPILGAGTGIGLLAVDNINIHILGLDIDAQFGNFSFAFTTLVNFGDITLTDSGQAAAENGQSGPAKDRQEDADETVRARGWLMWMSASYNFGMFDIHGQALYASGDDQEHGIADGVMEANYVLPVGLSWLGWAEIMGGGTFDNFFSWNSPGAQAQNLWFIGVGTTIRPMDKLSVSLDFWYAELVEDRVWQDRDGDWHKEDELGFEVDLHVTYQLIEGLNLDLAAAYLFAGDGTYKETSDIGGGWPAKAALGSFDAWDEADPWELGARLSLSF